MDPGYYGELRKAEAEIASLKSQLAKAQKDRDRLAGASKAVLEQCYCPNFDTLIKANAEPFSMKVLRETLTAMEAEKNG